MNTPEVTVEGRGTQVWTVRIARPGKRNAVDGATARALHAAFTEFDSYVQAKVAVLHGEAGVFCAGADLSAMDNPIAEFGVAPMGVSRLRLGKPVIAAVEGFAVAGGLEVACWCDMRVAAEDATFGVFCRRWGVPLIDGGTVRLPRLIGHSRAMDMILTGRAVSAREALDFGLVNRVVPRGTALQASLELARELCEVPFHTMLGDRQSAIEQWGMDEASAIQNEFVIGKSSLYVSAASGAKRFQAGAGRKGAKL